MWQRDPLAACGTMIVRSEVPCQAAMRQYGVAASAGSAPRPTNAATAAVMKAARSAMRRTPTVGWVAGCMVSPLVSPGPGEAGPGDGLVGAALVSRRWCGTAGQGTAR